MIRKLNELTLQKEIKKIRQRCVVDIKIKHNKNNKTKIKHKTPCESRKLNAGHLAHKADALPLDHRVN